MTALLVDFFLFSFSHHWLPDFVSFVGMETAKIVVSGLYACFLSSICFRLFNLMVVVDSDGERRACTYGNCGIVALDEGDDDDV